MRNEDEIENFITDNIKHLESLLMSNKKLQTIYQQ